MTTETFQTFFTAIVGVLAGGIATYFGESRLRKKREVNNHKACLIKIQFIMVHMKNEVLNLQKNYAQFQNDPNRHLKSPIFLTNSDWRLNRDLICDIFYKGTTEEKQLIVACSSLDKEFNGLIGSIDDKIKYYEQYKIDQHKLDNKILDEKIQTHMTELTNAIYTRIETTKPAAEESCRQMKLYMDGLYKGLAIDYKSSDPIP